MNIDLTGKNAFVFGASKGIGRAIAFSLASLGANVTLAARSAEKLAEISLELNKQRTSDHQDHDYLVVDGNDPADIKRKLQILLSGKIYHILINNTGGPPAGAILSADWEAFQQAFQMHLHCSHLSVQLMTEKMKEVGYGRIINIISTSVRMPIDGLGVSNTTRAAMASWAKTLANEVAPYGITVNNILPGFTATERLDTLMEIWAEQNGLSKEEQISQSKLTIPMKRFGTPEEIADVAAFLASPAASYVTGTSIIVDGGRTKSL
jgi:3-oxoacyl-[acyl-carrier protein] reductase